jgi:hypothetical protein
MDGNQLKAALLDLAEYGIIYLDALEDAKQVYSVIPEEIQYKYTMFTRLFSIYPRYVRYGICKL